MDLRNQESREFRLDLEHVGGYRFACQATEKRSDPTNPIPLVPRRPRPLLPCSGLRSVTACQPACSKLCGTRDLRSRH